ncbi:MAG TPA: bifunctional phosphoribosylaminoimidazolecarboxamide formyltransferase/IMP cyclohydrolase, partial [Wenzhouxiangella sp.]
MLFAWAVVRSVRSNAIVYAKHGQTLGLGVGQMSRIDSARFGVLKSQDAGLALDGAAMASEAFFPFADSIEAATSVGVRCIIQPGGSVRDEEVIAACNDADIAMAFTHRRHFKH